MQLCSSLGPKRGSHTARALRARRDYKLTSLGAPLLASRGITSALKTTSYNLAPTLEFEVGFSEGTKVAFPIVIKSYKLIGNSYKTKFVCSLFVGIQYCQITKPCSCGK